METFEIVIRNIADINNSGVMIIKSNRDGAFYVGSVFSYRIKSDFVYLVQPFASSRKYKTIAGALAFARKWYTNK